MRSIFACFFLLDYLIAQGDPDGPLNIPFVAGSEEYVTPLTAPDVEDRDFQNFYNVGSGRTMGLPTEAEDESSTEAVEETRKENTSARATTSAASSTGSTQTGQGDIAHKVADTVKGTGFQAAGVDPLVLPLACMSVVSALYMM